MSLIQKATGIAALAVVLILGVNTSALASPAETAGVHAADNAWCKAYNAGELENVVALYDEHTVVYPPGMAPVRGRAAVHEFFAADMAAFAKAGLVISLDDNPDGGVSGNTGWSSGTWTLKDKAGNVVDAGWYFSVSKKVAGKWLYVRDAWDSSKPAAAAPAAPGN